VKGNIFFKSNTNQSYYLFLKAGIPELNVIPKFKKDMD
jgi:hypothetical protein